ncbi:MAG: response regulator transcription factor [Coprobacillus sp.]
MANILVVDDDIDFLEIVDFGLRKRNHHPITVSNSQEALNKLNSQDIDLCVLDVSMEKEDSGFVLFNKLKQIRDIPILFLTSKNSLEDCLYGFELGADDYIYKPFSMDELVARINARLKCYFKSEEQYKSKDFSINIRNNQMTYQDKTLDFTNHEIQLIHFLAKHEGEIFNETQLYRYIWKSNITLNTRTCSVHIANIRKKMNKEWGYSFIQTCWGEGYKFILP